MTGRPPTVVVATANPGKLREIRAILAGLPLALEPLDAFGPVELPEEGGDYGANARAKAVAVARATGHAALADDSGLEVAGLEGRPGPYSARYGGAGLDDAGRVAHLLEEMRALDGDARRARFVCVAALATPDGSVATARGECHGSIRRRPAGRGGFGYDPVFEPAGHSRTLAELGPAEKDRLSHRARALSGLEEALRAL